ncbi:hypothetical protein D9619_000113 [Psilocybe cf. subviscida]|uniref:KOW domain-containing protein n=1 Tax=Psilocybe cf. subviscida TaxID=2480587 RepID=A0A8H5F274_9AGAR|nr:hypothetical protein D9619_000113 [Psilocybe cf. subviscida]
MSARPSKRFETTHLNPFVDIEAQHTDDPETNEEEEAEEGMEEFIDDTATNAAQAPPYPRQRLQLVDSDDQGSMDAFLKRARDRASRWEGAVSANGSVHVQHILETERNAYHAQTWRSYRGPLKVYRGDTGLVVSHGVPPSLMLALLPRLNTQETTVTGARAAQDLRNCAFMQAAFPSNVRPNTDDTFVWKGKVFTTDGLLLLPLLATAIGPETLPAREELELFSQTTSLARATYVSTTRSLSRRCVKPGKRVKIVLGEYIGLVGIVNHVQDLVANVWLESESYLAEIPLECLKMHFLVGDQVKIMSGAPWKNAIGWVIDIQENIVTVYLQDKNEHVKVITEHLDFYNAPFVRELLSPIVTDKNVHEGVVDVSLTDMPVESRSSPMGLSGRYVLRVGQAVYVVGATNLKCCRGYIRNTTYDGTAWVYLEASQREVLLNVKHLFPIPHGDVRIEEILMGPCDDGSASTDNATPVEAVAAPSTTAVITPVQSVNVMERAVPRPKVAATYPEWLRNVAGWGVMVVHEQDPYTICTVKRVEGDIVTILKVAHTETVPVQVLRALLPSQRGDLVVRTTGEDVAGVQVVQAYGEEECEIRKRGSESRLRKKYPRFPTEKLARVTPIMSFNPDNPMGNTLPNNWRSRGGTCECGAKLMQPKLCQGKGKSPTKNFGKFYNMCFDCKAFNFWGEECPVHLLPDHLKNPAIETATGSKPREKIPCANQCGNNGQKGCRTRLCKDCCLKKGGCTTVKSHNPGSGQAANRMLGRAIHPEYGSQTIQAIQNHARRQQYENTIQARRDMEDENILKTTVFFYYLKDADPIRMVIKTKVARQIVPNQQEELQAEELLNARISLVKVWDGAESLPDPVMEEKIVRTPTQKHPRPADPQTPTAPRNARRSYFEMSSPETSPTKRSRMANVSDSKERFNWPRTVAGMVELFGQSDNKPPAGREAQFFMVKYPAMKQASFYKYWKEYREAKALKLLDKYSDWADVCKDLGQRRTLDAVGAAELGEINQRKISKCEIIEISSCSEVERYCLTFMARQKPTRYMTCTPSTNRKQAVYTPSGTKNKTASAGQSHIAGNASGSKDANAPADSNTETASTPSVPAIVNNGAAATEKSRVPGDLSGLKHAKAPADITTKTGFWQYSAYYES